MTAAALWCPEVTPPAREQLSWRGGDDDPAVERHQLRLRPTDITTHHGRLLTTPEATLEHIARLSPFREAVAAGDQLLRLGISDERVAELMAQPPLRGHTRMVEVLRALDRRCTNRFESYTRMLLVAADIGPVECQWTLHGHAYDFWLPAIESLAESDGFEFHRDRPEYRRDRKVGQVANVRGVTLVRLSWEDVFLDWDDTIGLFHWVALAFRDRRAGAMGLRHPAMSGNTPERNPPMAPALEGQGRRNSHSTVREMSSSARDCPVRTQPSRS